MGVVAVRSESRPALMGLVTLERTTFRQRQCNALIWCGKWGGDGSSPSIDWRWDRLLLGFCLRLAISIKGCKAVSKSFKGNVSLYMFLKMSSKIIGLKDCQRSWGVWSLVTEIFLFLPLAPCSVARPHAIRNQASVFKDSVFGKRSARI